MSRSSKQIEDEMIYDKICLINSGGKLNFRTLWETLLLFIGKKIKKTKHLFVAPTEFSDDYPLYTIYGKYIITSFTFGEQYDRHAYKMCSVVCRVVNEQENEDLTIVIFLKIANNKYHLVSFSSVRSKVCVKNNKIILYNENSICGYVDLFGSTEVKVKNVMDGQKFCFFTNGCMNILIDLCSIKLNGINITDCKYECEFTGLTTNWYDGDELFMKIYIGSINPITINFFPYNMPNTTKNRRKLISDRADFVMELDEYSLDTTDEIKKIIKQRNLANMLNHIHKLLDAYTSVPNFDSEFMSRDLVMSTFNTFVKRIAKFVPSVSILYKYDSSGTG